MQNVIGIDLGSNSLGVVKLDCKRKEAIDSCSFVVRTASSLVAKNIIDNGAIDRIVRALNIAKEKIDFNNCIINAVTTEAMRVAKNSKEALYEIKDKTGIEFNVITGEKEAELTLSAVKNRLSVMGINRDFIALDIGGGSTEITIYKNSNFITKSFKIGIVTIVSEVKDSTLLKKNILEKVKPIYEFIKNRDIDNLEFIATAGTPTTIAALKHGLNYETYDGKVVNGTQLNINELDYYLEKLLNMDKNQRQIAVGTGREDLIIAGVMIFRAIYDILNKDSALVIDDSLREGVALEACSLNLQ